MTVSGALVHQRCISGLEVPNLRGSGAQWILGLSPNESTPTPTTPKGGGASAQSSSHRPRWGDPRAQRSASGQALAPALSLPEKGSAAPSPEGFARGASTSPRPLLSRPRTERAGTQPPA